MKNSIIVLIIIAIFCVAATARSNNDSEVVRALEAQNKQLARIAASLERISGQQPGWKLPK